MTLCGHRITKESGVIWPFKKKPGVFKYLMTNRVLLAFIVFILCSIAVLLTTGGLFGYNLDFLKNILIEAHGMLMDILIIGVFILWLNKKAEREHENRRYQEEIDDFKVWH